MRTVPTDNQSDTDGLEPSSRPLWRRFAVVAVYGAIFVGAATFGLVRYLKWRAAKNDRPVRVEESMPFAFKDELPFFVPRLAEIDHALGMHRYGPAREALEQLLAQVASPEMKALVKERLRDAMALQSLVVMLSTKISESQDEPQTYVREAGSTIAIVGVRPDCLIVVDSDKPRIKQPLDWHEIRPREMYDILGMYGLLEQLPLTSALFCAVNGFETEFRAFAFEAWSLFPDDRERIAAWFSWAVRGREYRACRVPGFRVTDLVAWEGKLITVEEEKAIASAATEADRQRAERERLQREENERLRMEEERRRREAEIDAAARERERLADEAEDREFPIALSELDRFVKVFRYKAALQGLQEYRGRLRRDKYRQQVTQRLNEVEKFLQLFERLKKTVNEHKLADAKVKFGKDLENTGTIVSATDDEFEVQVPQGFVKMRWEYLKPRQVYEFYQRLPLSTDDLVLLGIFCFELNLDDEAHACLVKALKQRPSLKEFVDGWVARQMGIELPPEGLVAYKGRLVTPIEKANREKGLVLFAGEWVTPEDRDMLAQGFKKFEGKWWARDEAELIAKGFRRYKEKWYSKDELAKLRQTWDEAWDWDTDHWKIKSNSTEEVCKELGLLLEQAYTLYGQFHGSSPRADIKMNMYVFKNFEDYREFCQKNGYESYLVAGGFANPGQNFCCGYIRGGMTVQNCLSVVLHEAAHLFHDRAFRVPTPSWYAEGLATYFEGGRWYGEKYIHDPISLPRLFYLKQAFEKEKYKSLAELVGGSAFASMTTSPQDAGLFYSEAWALYYFFNHTPKEEIRQKFKEFKEKLYSRTMPMAMEGEACLTAFKGVFGEDIAALEAEWKAFIKTVGQ